MVATPYPHPRRRARLWLSVLIPWLLLACGGEDGPTAAGQASGDGSATADPPPSTGAPLFLEAEDTGFDFVHWNGMTGALYFSEMVGPGAAVFDADGDGDLDIYLVQGHLLGATATVADAVFPTPRVSAAGWQPARRRDRSHSTRRQSPRGRVFPRPRRNRERAPPIPVD